MLTNRPNKLSLAVLPTEFRLLKRTSEALGGPRIWLKSDDQTGSLLSGNKVRKLEYLLADAISQECDTVLTCGGLQSNHCRATAAAAARLGLKCHLLLRGKQARTTTDLKEMQPEAFPEGYEGNLLLDTLCGAEVSVFSAGYYAKNLEREFDRLSDEYAKRGQKCYAIPTGGSNGVGLWGYVDALEEIRNDCERNGFTPDAIVCASGSGGTQGGLSLGAHLHQWPVPIFGMAVCDSEAYFNNKVKEDITEWVKRYAPDEEGTSLSNLSVATNTIDAYIGPGYAVGFPELFECIQWVAKTEGVVLDPVYTGKAFYGMVQEIKTGRFSALSDIVFVHTGGIYGVFPFKGAFV